MFLKNGFAGISVVFLVSVSCAAQEEVKSDEVLLKRVAMPKDPLLAQDQIEDFQLAQAFADARIAYLKARQARLIEEDKLEAALKPKPKATSTELVQAPIKDLLPVELQPRFYSSYQINGAWVVVLKYPRGRKEDASVGKELLNGGKVTRVSKRGIEFEWGGEIYKVR